MKRHIKRNTIPRKSSPLFRCRECKLYYPTEGLAKKCEMWCKKYRTCNIEITKQAIIKKFSA